MKKVVNFTGLLLLFLFSVNTLSVGAAEKASDGKQYVYLGGQPFGVKFYNDGVMIVRLEEYFSGHRFICPAQKGGLKINDVIKKVNREEIRTNEDLQRAAEQSDGKPLEIVIARDGKEPGLPRQLPGSSPGTGLWQLCLTV